MSAVGFTLGPLFEGGRFWKALCARQMISNRVSEGNVYWKIVVWQRSRKIREVNDGHGIPLLDYGYHRS